ncbi:hypothetical protein [Duganella callida]|uniref:Type II toxin-antitoxin system RelE/ParE family toxin n=1 Tax=Duganella callida TaxID=2561932 RepID=A0A4Y9SFW5_9BURK|nr:hypothetical protein [Duganella callida]TFW22567.1 hypothetical protein E4L98_11990 [Duganella callida]
MSRVKFDLESDGRFLTSVRDLGAGPEEHIISALEDMSNNLSWSQLICEYHWQEIPVVPTDSFPGANKYYSFILYFSPDEIYEIVALNYAPPDVVCVLARKTRLRT